MARPRTPKGRARETLERLAKEYPGTARDLCALTHDDPFPAGDYKAEIYLNDELVKTVEFKVK